MTYATERALMFFRDACHCEHMLENIDFIIRLTIDLNEAKIIQCVHFICFHIRIIISQFNDITAIHDSDVNMHASDDFCLLFLMFLLLSSIMT